MLVDNSVKDYMDVLSSDQPAPGGGSVSAVSGALGVSIMQMVASLSIGKKGLEDHQEAIKNLFDKADVYKEFFIKAIDEDSKCYPKVISAYRLPKDTDEEKEIRTEEIQKAYKYATEIPFSIGQKAHEFIDLLDDLIDISNKNIITDAYVSASQLDTCVDGALINARINLKYIKDKDFVDEKTEKIEFILKDSREKLDRIRVKIRNIM